MYQEGEVPWRAGVGSFVLIVSVAQIYHPNLDLEGNVCL
jgi:hypothetical protein